MGILFGALLHSTSAMPVLGLRFGYCSILSLKLHIIPRSLPDVNKAQKSIPAVRFFNVVIAQKLSAAAGPSLITKHLKPTQGALYVHSGADVCLNRGEG